MWKNIHHELMKNENNTKYKLVIIIADLFIDLSYNVVKSGNLVPIAKNLAECL